MWDGVTVITKPTAELLSLEALKKRIGVYTADQDEVIASALREAVAEVDGPDGIGLGMLTQTWRRALDAFPSGSIVLPGWPVKSVASVNYVDTDGNDTVWSAANYRLDAKREPARVTPVYGGSWPSTRAVTSAVWVDYVVGEATPGLVPQDLISAVVMLAAHKFDNRNAVIVGSINTELKYGVADILDRHRRSGVTT